MIWTRPAWNDSRYGEKLEKCLTYEKDRLSVLLSCVPEDFPCELALQLSTNYWHIIGNYDSYIRFVYEKARNRDKKVHGVQLYGAGGHFPDYKSLADYIPAINRTYRYDFDRRILPSWDRLVEAWRRYIQRVDKKVKEREISEFLTEKTHKEVTRALSLRGLRVKETKSKIDVFDDGFSWSVVVKDEEVKVKAPGLTMDCPAGMIEVVMNIVEYFEQEKREYSEKCENT